jgi:thiosulfate reductase cytochrome b subunit
LGGQAVIWAIFYARPLASQVVDDGLGPFWILERAVVVALVFGFFLFCFWLCFGFLSEFKRLLCNIDSAILYSFIHLQLVFPLKLNQLKKYNSFYRVIIICYVNGISLRENFFSTIS